MITEEALTRYIRKHGSIGTECLYTGDWQNFVLEDKRKELDSRFTPREVTKTDMSAEEENCSSESVELSLSGK